MIDEDGKLITRTPTQPMAASISWRLNRAKQAKIDRLEAEAKQRFENSVLTEVEQQKEIDRLKEEVYQLNQTLLDQKALVAALNEKSAQVERLRVALSMAYTDIGEMMGELEEPQTIRMMGEIAQEGISAILAETEPDGGK